MLNPNKIEDIKSIEKCREISREILRYGVNDLELIKIIDILSLELEDTNTMRNIQHALKSNNDISHNKPEIQI